MLIVMRQKIRAVLYIEFCWNFQSNVEFLLILLHAMTLYTLTNRLIYPLVAIRPNQYPEAKYVGIVALELKLLEIASQADHIDDLTRIIKNVWYIWFHF